MVSIKTTYAFGSGDGDSRKTSGKVIVLHSTADTNATAANIAQYFKNNWRTSKTYVHYSVDDKEAQLIGGPGYVAWGAGNVNIYAPVQIELCEFSDKARALKAYANCIELITQLCKVWGINRDYNSGNKTNGVKSHKWCAQVFGGSDHVDPVAYLASIGVSESQLAADIKAGKTNAKATVSTPAKATVTKVTPKINVTYGLRPIGAGFLPPVTNFGAGDSGYAGLPNHQHDLLYMRADHGTLKYHTHTLGGSWEAFVTKGDPNDTVNGCAGVPGKAIDGVEIIYITPAGEEYHQAWYRSQTVARSGWLGVVCDDGESVTGYTDSYAGMLGEALDRLQLLVGTSDPY